MRGYLMKPGTIISSNWKKRYFELQGCAMFVYANESMRDEEAKGLITLTDCDYIDPRPRCEGKDTPGYPFRLLFGGGSKAMTFCARTDEERIEWVHEISAKIEEFRHLGYDPTQKPIIEGWLTKRALSNKSKWRKRYFKVPTAPTAPCHQSNSPLCIFSAAFPYRNCILSRSK